MAGTNDFKAFATDANANVTSQEEWETLTALKKGFSSGKASSAQVSKALRQPSTMAAVLGQFIANAELDALDDGDVDGLVAKLATAITTNLGLGTAAKRAVGTGANQIPDMSSFQSILSTHGYQRLPGGIIIQWGLAPAPVGVASQKSYPITFPNAVWHVFMCHNVHNDPSGLGLSGASVAPGNSVFDYMIQAIKVSDTTVTATPAGTTNMGMHFFAIGY
ncbi:hypothetical protein ACNDZ4_004293 [Escherichia coli]|nr:hypothetical protein [Escherichia coli]